MKNLILSIFFITYPVLLGFTMPQHQENDYTSKNQITVKGDIIYLNDAPFAELRYFMTDRKNNQHRGICLYYYRDNKETWIYPEQGWRMYQDGREYNSLRDVEKLWLESNNVSDLNERQNYRLFLGNKMPDKNDFLKTWVLDVKISEDGRYVSYKTPGIFFNSSHKYLVEYGVSK